MSLRVMIWPEVVGRVLLFHVVLPAVRIPELAQAGRGPWEPGRGAVDEVPVEAPPAGSRSAARPSSPTTHRANGTASITVLELALETGELELQRLVAGLELFGGRR